MSKEWAISLGFSSSGWIPTKLFRVSAIWFCPIPSSTRYTSSRRQKSRLLLSTLASAWRIKGLSSTSTWRIWELIPSFSWLSGLTPFTLELSASESYRNSYINTEKSGIYGSAKDTTPSSKWRWLSSKFYRPSWWVKTKTTNLLTL